MSSKIILKQESASSIESVSAWYADIFIDSADSKVKIKTPSATVVVASEESITDTFAFWPGSDGNVTITTTITLTRDMYYDNLTITSPWILIPNWYRFFVKWTLSGNWKIQRNGNAWWAWASVTAWIAGTTLNQGNLNAELAAAAWGAGNANSAPYNWAAWDNWAAANPSYTQINWAAGWHGWNWYATWGVWWTAWTATRGILYNVSSLYKYFASVWPASYVLNTTQYLWAASASWGWGWSAWNNGATWGGWGWAWTNWWLIRACINIVNRTWTREAIGWVWGKWGSSSWGSVNWWVWGWGWGWNGWTMVLFYKTLTSVGTITLTWWTGWVIWDTWATTAAVAWADGNAWVSIQIAI